MSVESPEEAHGERAVIERHSIVRFFLQSQQIVQKASRGSSLCGLEHEETLAVAQEDASGEAQGKNHSADEMKVPARYVALDCYFQSALIELAGSK